MILLNNRLKSVLCSNSLDYLLVTDFLNMYYLTGYQGRLGFCLISRLGKVYLCVPKHLKTQALRSDLNNYEYEVITYSTTAALFNDTNIISKGSILGFENNLPFYLFNLLKNISHIQLKNVSALMKGLRSIKSNDVIQ
ncbi:aminopeptidase P family N-terminal domain-containing protein [Mammaliicoccus lentus]|uniref:aminopeptidase P family N-terminal domain-containing protein n=1 Tax=Mammaliicoccus lentus TaxID=42858 RepID=UPI002647E22C|nr:aminopeptidase P family N-terminal domain-containing protein [Mammaliicoccus lentus]